MITAEQIIQQINALSLEERAKVRNYLIESQPKEEFIECEYSNEEMEDMINDLEDAKKGINVSPAFDSMDDAIQWLNAPE